MAFSLRSFFGKDKPDEEPHGHSPMTASPFAQQGGGSYGGGNGSGNLNGSANPFATQDVFLGASTPAQGKNGFHGGASPFSPAVSMPSTGLTVQDILPALPPEVVKPAGVLPDQPLQIPNAVLERSLRSGQAALPLFEIYRVCPALFRVTITPEDPRMVPLPHHKLGGLAAMAKKAPLTSANMTPPSPETSLFHPSPFHQNGGALASTSPTPPPSVPAPAPTQSPAPELHSAQNGHGLFVPSPAMTFSSNPFASPPGSAKAQGQQGDAPPSAPAPLFGEALPQGAPPSPAPLFGGNPTAAGSLPVNPFTKSHNETSSFFGPGPSPAPQAPAPAQPPVTDQGPIQGQSPPFPSNLFPTSPPSVRDPFLSPPQPAAPPQAAPQAAAPNPPWGEPANLPRSSASEPAPTRGQESWSLPGSIFSPNPASEFPAAPAASPGINPFDRIKALAGGPSTPPALSELPKPPIPAPEAAPAPAPSPAEPVVRPAFAPLAAQLPASAGSPESKKVTLSLATALSRCQEKEIGVKPEMVPSWVQVSLPMEILNQPHGSGWVAVRVVEIMRGLEPEFRSLVNPSSPDLLVEIPVNALFHALPSAPEALGSSAPPNTAAPAAPTAPAPPVKPAGELGAEALGAAASFKPEAAAGSPENLAALPSLFTTAKAQPEPSPPTTQLPAGVPWPFEAGTSTPSFAPSGFSGSASLFVPSATDDPPASPPPPAGPFPSPPLPQRPEGLPAMFQVEPSQAEPVKPATRSISPSAISFAPGIKAAMATDPGPSPAPAPAPVAAPSFARAPADRSRQLLLRVLLSTEDDLDVSDIIRLTASLPGVSAAVCLRGGQIIGSATNGSPEASAFVAHAPKVQQHLEPLIELTGILDTETLSMKSDQQMASFSLQGEMVLGVLHDPGKNEPTLRERITLIARELKTVLATET